MDKIHTAGGQTPKATARQRLQNMLPNDPGRTARGALVAAFIASGAFVPLVNATTAPPAPPAHSAPPAQVETAKNDVRGKIVDAARAEIGTPESGDNCQKYSDQCVSWCALFAMDTWEKAGVDVDNDEFAFTGDVYTTGQGKGTAYSADELHTAAPGDVLLFGTGPQSPSTSKHIGVVESVQGDRVTLIEGNTGDDPDRVMRKDHKLSDETFYGGVRPL